MENQEVNLNGSVNPSMEEMQAQRKAVMTKGTSEAKEYKGRLEYEVEILELEARHIEAQYKAMAGKVALNNMMQELSKGLVPPTGAMPEATN
jgi:uncharacterized protein involved in exopolysaccharide biosynthesis